MQDPQMTIYIIGTGAIGKSLAVFLTLQGEEVILLRARINETHAAVEHVAVELPDGTILQSIVTVCALHDYHALDGIIILATKSPGNETLAQHLASRTGNSPVVIMQNGLDVEAPFLNNSFPEIYRCVLFTSCQFTGNNRLRFTPASPSLIGITRGSIQRLEWIVACMQNPHLIFKAEETIQPVIWTKVIINSVFNSVCPLLETDNGIFHRNERALDLAETIIDECIAVAEGEGIALQKDKVLEKLLLISKSSDGQLISTYQDIIHKRTTEINTLNIAIVLKAEKLKLTSLVQRTKLLGKLIQIKSEISISDGEMR